MHIFSMRTPNILWIVFLAAISTGWQSYASASESVSIANTQNTTPLSDSDIDSAAAFHNPLPSPDDANVKPSRLNDFPSRSAGYVSHSAGQSRADFETRAFGAFKVPYTSKRVSLLPTSAVNPDDGGYLSATYPYRAIGNLTFKVGEQSAYCSASLIRRSVLVTAAHCIQNFNGGNNFFSDWTFTPAYYKGNKPYGSWSWQYAVLSLSWSNGTDKGVGPARANDLAVIVLSKNAQDPFAGDVVGWLNYGWNNYSFVKSGKTGNLWTASLSTLGYPALLDSGAILQRSDGPSYLTNIRGAGQIYQGSNFTGGASGGPWIANFGYENPDYSGGAGPGEQAVGNIVVGVTSWGSANPNLPKDNYSSQFRQNTQFPGSSYGVYGAGNIGALVNVACNGIPQAGGPTNAALGYCD
jgi:hypothetical protein